MMLVFVACSQTSIVLNYKKSKCGGVKPNNTDTTTYFPLTNKKWIIQYPGQKIDTIYTDKVGKIKLPNKKGTYYLYTAWKYYHLSPPEYPIQFYDKDCLKEEWNTPDFKITIHSRRKYTISPPFLNTLCPHKHPCIRKDTVVPIIPMQN